MTTIAMDLTSVCVCIIVVLLTCHVSSFSLDCGYHSVIEVNEDTVIQFPGSEYYKNSEYCTWTFISNSVLELKFTKLDLESNSKGQCVDHVSIQLPSYNRSQFCHLDDKTYTGEYIGLTFESGVLNSRTGFTAVIKLSGVKKTLHSCDFGTNNKGSILSVYKMDVAPDSDNGNNSKGMKNFEGEYRTNVISYEAITVGNDVGTTVCYDGKIQMPLSKTPSCHADSMGKCQWTTTARHLTAISGNLFLLSNEKNKFHTVNVLQTDKICFHIEYRAISPVKTTVYAINVSNSTKTQITYVNLNGTNSWQIKRIVADIPESLKPLHIRLELQMNIKPTENVFVKKIFGCNPYRQEDRFILSSSHTERIMGLREFSNISDYTVYCRNGGILSGDGCHCPVGYAGLNCQKVCGPNMFGKDCEGRCSSEDRECQSMIFCSPNVGCFCAPGWQGPNCEQKCPSGKYGISCNRVCGQCKFNASCNPYSGVCQTGCPPGYVPPYCAARYAYLNKTAEVVSANETTVQLKVKLYSFVDVIGFGTPKFYKVQYREYSPDEIKREKKQWIETSPKPIPSNYSILEEISNLSSGVAYKVRIIFLNEDLMSYEGDDLPTALMQTKQSVPRVKNLVVYKKSRNMVGLRWEIPEHLFGTLDSFFVSVNGEPASIIKPPTRCQSWPQLYCYEIEDLKPEMSYNFSVSAHNGQLNEYGITTYVSENTVEGAPETPVNLKILNITENTIDISWSPPSIFNGIIRSYLISIKQIESYDMEDCCEDYPKLEVMVTDEKESYETQLTGLMSGSKYIIGISAETTLLGPATMIEATTRPYQPRELVSSIRNQNY